MTSKKNPQDSTRRNVQASVKRDKKLAEEVKELKEWKKQAEQRLEKLENKMANLLRGFR